MKIGPKYKIARRLGAEVFEKTQNQKFLLSQEKKKSRRAKATSNFGKQLLEKQKVRLNYNISEKQFRNYVHNIISKKIQNPSASLFDVLERRLDSVVLRAGFAKTRFASRQMVSHGHITLNGKKANIPSLIVKTGDVIGIKEGSKNKGMFINLVDQIAEITIPEWLKVDSKNYTVSVLANPNYSPKQSSFDLQTVIQFYKR